MIEESQANRALWVTVGREMAAIAAALQDAPAATERERAFRRELRRGFLSVARAVEKEFGVRLGQ